MLEIFRSMMKEEWRMHATMIGGTMFAAFPVMLMFFSFIATFFLPIFMTVFSIKSIALLLHFFFVFFGLSVGSFGLVGREAMNRRFGQASLIAYSSRSLPVSEKQLFLNFFMKDLLYYFLLWILPIVAGFGIGMPFVSFSIDFTFMHVVLLLVSLSLSFLIGLSFVFLLSTIYVHSRKMLIGLVFLMFLFGLIAGGFYNMATLSLLPSFAFMLDPRLSLLLISLAMIIIPSSLSIIFLKIDYPVSKKKHKNMMKSLCDLFRQSRYSHFIAKDFIDQRRSHGGVGKIIFSFLFPILIIWLLLFVFFQFIPTVNFLVMFAICMVMISSSIYNWVTQYDLFVSYAFLPVSVSSVIKAKLRTYVIMNIISVLVLLFVGLLSGTMNFFLPALCAFIGISAYVLAITIYIAGLHPNVMLYNAKLFLMYAMSILPVLIVTLVVSAVNPIWLFFSPLLVLASLPIMKKSYRKWDSTAQAWY
ncbi:hypothetical protein COV93_00740 [Candidatus Woesearchaeota archaeon CG11_big_fil_rev_8_21_14_0_20_43_8]|nr:MAG: hypothetical protein COV93_00740 [Candidatus Woesearchaeota archaeon CG11_big_fil_rev_8_21_14_0_20_43_8]